MVADFGVRLRRAQSSRSVERSAGLCLCGEIPLRVLSRCRQDPGVGRVVVKVPNAFGTRHHIEVIGLITMWDHDGVVATRHQNNIAIADGHGLIKVA